MTSILIENGYLITLDAKRRIFKNGSVVLQDEKIVDLGKADVIKGKKYKVSYVVVAEDEDEAWETIHEALEYAVLHGEISSTMTIEEIGKVEDDE